MSARVFARSLVLLVLTFIGIMVFWYFFSPRQGEADGTIIDLNEDNPYSSLYIPSFTLVDRNGEEFDESFLDGKYTVVDFFYTSCPLICPAMTATMREIQDATSDTELQLLSVSIDPEVDTPEVMDRYAGGFQAQPERWKFGRGTEEMTQILLMGVGFELDALELRDGFRYIDHPGSLLLVGPDRHVIKLYRYSDADEVRALIEKARELAG
ncbi:MAG: SCO family protein [Phycisphaerales bacterium]|nr:SCO family protein [Phycisphaerales bacterium]